MNSAPQTEHAARQSASIIILRLRDVQAKTGLSRSTIYDAVAKGDFPKQVPLSTRRVGWLASEVDAWIEKRVRARI
ncbi:AlpA family transcriptional regulator [Paraburkholderia sediminicola]|uniref:helix-turn-helix transcriptional regulator n=1 Tax=Paraburkholderia sediminicola TaxID=458836 RepID=UPI0038BCECE6